jgi:DNA-binding protein YbaB
MERSWGFEEAEDVDEPAEPAADEPLSGADAGGVVTVTVDDTAAVVSVLLGDGWQDATVRRGLGARVVEALTAATARVMAKKAERIGEPAPRVSVSPDQDGPLTTAEVMRLMDAVSRDLAQFRQRLSAVADETVTATSGGGHVTVSGRRRQAGDVSVDQDWLYGARASEVESELRDALTTFAGRSSPGELAQGPKSAAISELLALVSDPQAMVHRLRRRSA